MILAFRHLFEANIVRDRNAMQYKRIRPIKVLNEVQFYICLKSLVIVYLIQPKSALLVYKTMSLAYKINLEFNINLGSNYKKANGNYGFEMDFSRMISPNYILRVISGWNIMFSLNQIQCKDFLYVLGVLIFEHERMLLDDICIT